MQIGFLIVFLVLLGIVFGMMSVTKYDVAAIKHFSLTRCAAAVGIKYGELFDLETLREKIVAQNPVLWEEWQSFTNAYQAWFDFSGGVEKDENQGRLDEEGRRELLQLMEKRDVTRTKLIETLRCLEGH